jgi:DNA-binding transcriptional LysR family regulator
MWPVPDRRRNNTPERVFKPAGRAREDDHDHHPRRVRRAGVGHARMRRTVVLTTPRFLAVPSLVARAPVVVTMHARLARFFAAELGLSLSLPPVELQDMAVSLLWHASYDHDPATHGYVR